MSSAAPRYLSRLVARVSWKGFPIAAIVSSLGQTRLACPNSATSLKAHGSQDADVDAHSHPRQHGRGVGIDATGRFTGFLEP